MVTTSQTRQTPSGATAKTSRRIAPSPMPATIERSDRHAQSLWRKAQAGAIKTYGDGALARRVAFSALKHEYERRGNRWVRKDVTVSSVERPARGVSAKPRAATRSTGAVSARAMTKTARPTGRASSKKAKSARKAH